MSIEGQEWLDQIPDDKWEYITELGLADLFYDIAEAIGAAWIAS